MAYFSLLFLLFELAHGRPESGETCIRQPKSQIKRTAVFKIKDIYYIHSERKHDRHRQWTESRESSQEREEMGQDTCVDCK